MAPWPQTPGASPRRGRGQVVLREFIDYSAGLPVIFLVGFPRSVEVGISFASGSIVYALLAAYSHQIQHERPELVYWLKRPVHHLHHTHNMRAHNFGILVDFWDRVFGTYKIVQWNPERHPSDNYLRAFFQIKWYWHAPRNRRRRRPSVTPTPSALDRTRLSCHDLLVATLVTSSPSKRSETTIFHFCTFSGSTGLLLPPSANLFFVVFMSSRT